MPNRRTSIRKIKEVLRLKYGNKRSEREIAISCSISKTTVAAYLKKARAAGLSWPLPGELDDSDIMARLFPPQFEGEPHQSDAPKNK